MLKRYQVLLDDWLADYIKLLAERYDLSFSEIIRVTLCYEFINMTHALYPKYRLALTKKEIARRVKKINAHKLTRAEHHMILSKVYFEARKAIEFRLSKEKPKNK